MIRTFSLAMLVATFAALQTPARDRAVDVPVPAGTAVLAGVVADAAGQPLKRASVSISGDMRLDRRMITDDNGRFAFANLPAGRFTITAVKGAYPPMSYGAKRSNRSGSGVLLADGQQITNLTVTLARGAVLTGTVFDDHGQPMPEVPVMAYEVRTSLAGERTFDFPPSGGEWVTTDDHGTYRIYNLPPGEYTVGTSWAFHGLLYDARVPTDAEIRAAFLAVTQAAATSARGAAAPTPPAKDARFNFAPVYYPDSVDPLNAATLTLGSGEERAGIDIHMQLRQMSRIEGTVMGPGGPVPNIGLVLMRRSRVAALNSSTFWGGRADGTFASSSLSPGDYTILAVTRAAPGEMPEWASTDVTIAGADPANVTLTLQPAMSVSGRLVFEGKTLEPPKEFSRVRVSLNAMQGTVTANNITTSPVDAAGNFRITGITGGRFRLNAGLPSTAAPGQPAWSVKSVVMDGRDLTDLPIDFGSGSGSAVTVTFTDEVSELSGRLVAAAGESASDYFIVALPADRAYWTVLSRRIVSTRPDASGQYVFRGLPAGEYRLAATTDLVPRDLQIVEALTQLVAQSIPVTLGLGEKKTLPDLKIGR